MRTEPVPHDEASSLDGETHAEAAVDADRRVPRIAGERLGLGTVLSGERVRVIAPAGSDAATGAWVDVSSGGRPRVVVGNGRGEPGDVRIATYGEEIVSLLFHPESKMLGPDGDVCKATTRGLLTPRPVLIGAVHLVGKEGNRIDEVATREVLDPDEVLTEYGDDAWESIYRRALRSVTVTQIARRVGMDRAGLSSYLRPTSPRRPPQATLSRLVDLVSTLASEGAVRSCALPGCSAPSRKGPSTTCSERHRRALARLSADQSRCDRPSCPGSTHSVRCTMRPRIAPPRRG